MKNEERKGKKGRYLFLSPLFSFFFLNFYLIPLFPYPYRVKPCVIVQV
jgi:hypothetical protein